jgi:hypothetical protein
MYVYPDWPMGFENGTLGTFPKVYYCYLDGEANLLAPCFVADVRSIVYEVLVQGNTLLCEPTWFSNQSVLLWHKKYLLSVYRNVHIMSNFTAMSSN